MFEEEPKGVLWYEGMMSSSQGTQRCFGFAASFSGIIVYRGSPVDVGSASRADAAHPWERILACCSTVEIRHNSLFF